MHDEPVGKIGIADVLFIDQDLDLADARGVGHLGGEMEDVPHDEGVDPPHLTDVLRRLDVHKTRLAKLHLPEDRLEVFPFDDPEIPAGILVEVGDELVRRDLPCILIVAGAGKIENGDRFLDPLVDVIPRF